MSKMERAYDLAAAAVRERLARQRADRLELLNSVANQDVIVYSGSYDSVQQVLDRLRIPFRLDPPPTDLNRARIVFANCSNDSDPAVRTHIEPFVRNGGWLVSTDWSLANIVARCFPNTIGRKPGGNSHDEVVAVEPNRDSLWSDVVVIGADPQWWLESSSYPVEIHDPERVRVEAASHELLVRYGAPTVAARFDWGEGHVYHVISHLWLKRTRTPSQPRYAEPCTSFLRHGMRLDDESIAAVLTAARVKAKEFNFATLQSAATSTELVAQLCIAAVGSVPPPSVGEASRGDTRLLCSGSN